MNVFAETFGREDASLLHGSASMETVITDFAPAAAAFVESEVSAPGLVTRFEPCTAPLETVLPAAAPPTRVRRRFNLRLKRSVLDVLKAARGWLAVQRLDVKPVIKLVLELGRGTYHYRTEAIPRAWK